MVDQPQYTTVVKLQQTTDGGLCYIAYHPELPECISQGETPEEAQTNLEEATQMVLEHMLQNQIPIPKPQFGYSIQMAPLKFADESDASVWSVPSAKLVSLPASR